MEDAINSLRKSNDRAAARAAAKILRKLLSNVAKFPDDAKYRKVKRDNKVLKAKLWPVPGAESLLIASGFVLDENRNLILNVEDADIHAIEIRRVRHGLLMVHRLCEHFGKVKTVRKKTSRHDLIAKERELIIKEFKSDRKENVDMREARGPPRKSEPTLHEFGDKNQKTFSDVGIDLNKGGGG